MCIQIRGQKLNTNFCSQTVQAPPNFRKILVSVKFLSAILGPEMGAPILWTPGKNAFFLQENLHVHKIPRFGGGLGFGGGSADFIFMGAGIFLRIIPPKARDIPPKSLVSLGFEFEGHTELFGPHPSRGRPPPHPKISGPKSLGLGSFLRAPKARNCNR